jgi:hypothetical protein
LRVRLKNCGLEKNFFKKNLCFHIAHDLKG